MYIDFSRVLYVTLKILANSFSSMSSVIIGLS